MTIVEKQMAIQLHVRGFKKNFIANHFGRGVVTIYNVIKDWKNGKFLNVKQRTQRRLKLSAQQVFNTLQYFVNHPFHTHRQCIKSLKLPVSVSTIRKVLSKNGVRNYVACNKQFLSIQNQIKRLKFAIKYQNWTNEWLEVCFMDEKTVQTYANGRVLVKRKINERYNPDMIVTSESQNSRNKVNLVGTVAFNGPNVTYSVSTNFNGAQFEQLLKTKIKNHITGTVLMDNATIHSKGMKWLLKSGIRVLDFPPKSPDMNIIENVWGMLQKILNRKLLNVTISSKNQLLQMIDESWKEIPNGFIQQCILSMPNRLKQVIKVKGRQTKY